MLPRSHLPLIVLVSSVPFPVFRIRFGSVFNWVSWSRSGLGIRIQADKNCPPTPQKKGKKKKFHVWRAWTPLVGVKADIYDGWGKMDGNLVLFCIFALRQSCTYYFNNACQSIFVKLFTGYFLGCAAEEVGPETEVAGKQQRGPAGSGRGGLGGQDARHTAPDWLTRRAWHTWRCHHQVPVVAIWSACFGPRSGSTSKKK